MIEDKIVKAEVLITRRCNLRCKTCQVIHPKLPQGRELTSQEWDKAFDIVYNKLGADFIAVYGGEPLILGRNKLGNIIESLAKHRPKKSFTIISNSVGLKEEDMDYFMNRGLDSWTASVDCLPQGNSADKFTKAKSQVGLSTLLKFKEKGLRDTCGIITVTKKNLLQVPETTKFLTDLGIWTGIDLLHYDSPERLDGMDNFSTDKKYMKELLLDNIDDVRNVASKLIQMKKEGALIFPTFKTLEAWKNPNYSLNLNWSCKNLERPYLILLDADGTLGACDQFQPSELKKYSIFDMPEKWNDFSNQYMKSIRDRNCRCFWSTHYCLDEIANTKDGMKYYQHEKESIKE